jgi:hypothetical protein
VSADLGTYSSYGCLTVSRKPFFRLQATSFCAVPRLPTAHVPVSADLGAYLFSDCLTVSRKPFSRLQATSFCIPEIAYCSGSSEHGSRDVSIAWLSCSQPGALLPTASNIFLCSPEITSCSGSSTEKLLKNMIRRPGEQQMLLARCHIARQQAGKLFIYREHRCSGFTCRDEAWSRTGWSTLRRFDRASCFANTDCLLQCSMRCEPPAKHAST